MDTPNIKHTSEEVQMRAQNLFEAPQKAYTKLTQDDFINYDKVSTHLCFQA
jgi:hypothetical protein